MRNCGINYRNSFFPHCNRLPNAEFWKLLYVCPHISHKLHLYILARCKRQDVFGISKCNNNSAAAAVLSFLNCLACLGKVGSSSQVSAVKLCTTNSITGGVPLNLSSSKIVHWKFQISVASEFQYDWWWKRKRCFTKMDVKKKDEDELREMLARLMLAKCETLFEPTFIRDQFNHVTFNFQWFEKDTFYRSYWNAVIVCFLFYLVYVKWQICRLATKWFQVYLCIFVSGHWESFSVSWLSNPLHGSLECRQV